MDNEEGNEIVLEEVELADGTKINVLKEEAFKGYQEGVSKSAEEKEALYKEQTEELEKEKAKDKNFANLRQKKLSELSDEEKAAISEDRKELMAQQEQYNNDRAEDKKEKVSAWKIKAFKDLGLLDPEGNIVDDDQYKKIDASMARLNDPEDSADAVLKKAKAAYSLEFGNQPNIGERSINSAVQFGGGGNIPKPGKERSANATAVAKALGIDLEDTK